jgi:hypothetical protein
MHVQLLEEPPLQENISGKKDTFEYRNTFLNMFRYSVSLKCLVDYLLGAKTCP